MRPRALWVASWSGRGWVLSGIEIAIIGRTSRCCEALALQFEKTSYARGALGFEKKEFLL